MIFPTFGWLGKNLPPRAPLGKGIGNLFRATAAIMRFSPDFERTTMSEDLRTAIVVNPSLPAGFLANTVAVISIGLGARMPQLAGTRLTDREGRSIDVSSNRPVPVLQGDGEMLRALLLKAVAKTPELAVVPFPAFARSLHAFEDYERAFPERDLGAEAIDGIGLAGPEKLVRSLTGALKLLR
jgi:hypothetical protein